MTSAQGSIPDQNSTDSPGDWRKPTRQDMQVVLIWLSSRVAILFTAYATSWLLDPNYSLVSDAGFTLRGFTQQWLNWDATFLRGIAADGYQGAEFAFLPLFPAIVSAFDSNPDGFTLASVLLNGMFGAIAAVLLSRIATTYGYDGRWAVIALATAPSTLFLTAPYTEALFLALALGAWIAALKDRYWLMGILCGLAVLTRLNGLFLVLALFAMLLVKRKGLNAIAWLSIPILAAIVWQVATTVMSGRATTLLDVQREFWNNSLTDPISALKLGWTAAFIPEQYDVNPSFTVLHLFIARLQLLSLAILILVAIALAVYRKWPELTYVLVSLLALQNTTGYISLHRYLIVIWPVWLIIGLLLARSWTVRALWFATAAPLAILFTATFSLSRWAG